MKKQFLAVSAVAGLVLGAAIAHGADSKGQGIVGSVHDMNFVAGTYSISTDTDRRLCAFCHTPHHAVSDNNELSAAVANLNSDIDNDGTPDQDQYYVYAPLWSRQDLASAGPYEPYVSATFNPDAMGKPYDNLIGPSRLCLTCHDGTIALDAYYNNPAPSANVTTDELNFFGSKNIGIAATSALMNDHPIGMKYTDFLSATYETTDYELNAVATQFKKSDGTDGRAISQVLFKDPRTPGVEEFVTCASCHDVHNGTAVGNMNPPSDRGYLLYGSQKNSSFCLTCHNKNNGVLPDSTY